MKKNITMVELAKLANVDVSTVSRALNDSPLVKASTKEHVLKIARENKFVVNAVASNLRQKTTQTISVMFPPVASTGQSISDPFFLQMFGAITEAASRKGYHVIVSCRDADIDNSEEVFLQSGLADGAIIIGQYGREKRLNELSEMHKDIVVWGAHSTDANYLIVGSDNLIGGRKAASHLLETGHKAIGFVGNTDLPEVALRYQGYLEAHQMIGCKVDPQLYCEQDFHGANLIEKLEALFVARNDLDALFCASDVLAMAAINGLETLGLNVPADISVIGYDGIAAAEYATPPLTTVSQNIPLGGKMLVDALLDKIQGAAVDSQFTPTELIFRNSTRERRNPISKSIPFVNFGKWRNS